MTWKTGKPKKYGRYLVTITLFGKCSIVDIISYGEMDNFVGKPKKVCWFDYDGEYGEYEVTTNVIAWMELPEPFEKKEDNNETTSTDGR